MLGPPFSIRAPDGATTAFEASGGPLLLEGQQLPVELCDLSLELLDLVEAGELESGVDPVDAGIDILLDALFDFEAKLLGTPDAGNLAQLVLDLLDALLDSLLALLAKSFASALEPIVPFFEFVADALDAFVGPIGSEILPIPLVSFARSLLRFRCLLAGHLVSPIRARSRRVFQEMKILA